ncbi:carcinoembryonic antigen-related cell adhesion molecule 20-like [Melanotaenia boesemani]|uniref:carcinoembryonic antigen-related cell adhesion molecule 20-like n=1 Tax=Melanotaenia boesemani TaxID=1250792 RepID=UPI001C046B85|nr:carcinoembryonic antigen-related cell adhesion molecule 20-like [Melanotaenia boesemani]
MDLLALKLLLLLLSFTGCSVGQEILPEGPVDALLGKNVTLEVLYKKDAGDDVIWNYSDGQDALNVATLRGGRLTVSVTYKDRAFINDTNGYLTLSFLKSKDSGDYSITVLTPGGAVTGEIKLRIIEPVADIAITSNLTEAIEINSTVALTCSVKGNFLKLSWFNITTPITVDGVRLSLKEEALSSTLTIRGVLRSDLVGPIYCEAKNPLQRVKSNPFNLTVFYGPDDVTIKPTKHGPYIRSKSDFNLTCSTPSFPPATFTWYYNNSQIQTTGPVLTLKTIEDQGFGQKEGNYTCRAQNTKTMRYGVSPAIRFSVTEPISGINITGPTTPLIAGNSTANLSCQATAGKVMERIWIKDEAPLAASSRVVFSDDKSSVMINPLQKEDNGKYLCVLKNPVSEEKATYMMTVNYGPESVELKGKPAVEVEDKVELNCLVKSVPPAAFIWKLNGTVIPVNAMTLTIEKAQYKDSGIYTCEAYNAMTGKRATSTSHTLSVKEEIHEGLTDGAIAGIVIACLVAVGAAIGVFFYCRSKVPAESPY